MHNFLVLLFSFLCRIRFLVAYVVICCFFFSPSYSLWISNLLGVSFSFYFIYFFASQSKPHHNIKINTKNGGWETNNSRTIQYSQHCTTLDLIFVFILVLFYLLHVFPYKTKKRQTIFLLFTSSIHLDVIYFSSLSEILERTLHYRQRLANATLTDTRTLNIQSAHSTYVFKHIQDKTHRWSTYGQTDIPTYKWDVLHECLVVVVAAILLWLVNPTLLLVLVFVLLLLLLFHFCFIIFILFLISIQNTHNNKQNGRKIHNTKRRYFFLKFFLFEILNWN